MSKKEKKTHYIYKTTCIITGRYYIGKHSTSNINDGYMGSGKVLRYSIRKYGVDNHCKEILEFLGSKEELSEREKQIVNDDLIKDIKCMNVALGGYGGFNLSKDECRKNASKSHQVQKWLSENDTDWLKNRKENASKGNKKRKENGYIHKGNKDYKWTKDTRNRILKKREENDFQKGFKNSQFGSCWITNGVENKKIKKTDELPNGWIFGRKIKIGNN